jgi:hypothetical protein
MAAEGLGGKLLGEVEVGSLEEVSDVFSLPFGSFVSRLSALMMSMSVEARYRRLRVYS